MNIKLSIRSLAATAALALAGLGMTGAAQARDDVYWSVGLSSPGVQLGFANAPPVILHQPVYGQPYPVYSEPRTVYRQPPVVYMAPRPIVYVRPAPVYMPPPQYIRAGWDRPGRGWGRRHGGRHPVFMLTVLTESDPGAAAMTMTAIIAATRTAASRVDTRMASDPAYLPGWIF